MATSGKGLSPAPSLHSVVVHPEDVANVAAVRGYPTEEPTWSPFGICEYEPRRMRTAVQTQRPPTSTGRWRTVATLVHTHRLT